VLSDDIYEYLVYDDAIFSAPVQIVPELSNRVLIVNGVAKSYCVTGWQIGYAGGL